MHRSGAVGKSAQGRTHKYFLKVAAVIATAMPSMAAPGSRISSEKGSYR
jgi:hypothetical protein